MKTAGALSDRSKKDLMDLARQKGVRGFARMDKDELVRALGRLTAKPAAKPAKPAPRPTAKPLPRPAAKSAAKVTKPAKPVARPAAKPAVNGTHRPATRIPAPPPQKVSPAAPKVAPVAAKPPVPAPKPAVPAQPPIKTNAPPPAATKDGILLMVPDPFCRHAYWELRHQSVQRAAAALKQAWYGARPVIRLFDVTSTDTTSTSETPVRDIFVHGE